MSAQNVRVGVVFSAALRGFSEFKRLGGGMTGLAGAVKKVRGELAILGATLAFDFMKNALMTMAAFDHSMKKVQAVTGGTTEQLKELTDEARQLGRDFPFTASEAADAMFELSLAGLSVNEVMATTETTLNLAMAGNMALAQSARIAVATMNAFGYEAEQVGEIGDVLTAAFTNSAMTLAELGAGLSFVGPVAAIANVSLEDSVTVLGLFANAGIAGARSGTTFRQMLSKMLDPTTDATRRMQELGLAFTDANGDLLPMVDIVEQLIDAQMTANDVITVFGIRAAPGVGALIQQGVEGFQEMSTEINNSEGALTSISDIMRESAQNQFKMFTSAMEDFKIVLGNTLMPLVTAFIDAFRGEGGLGQSLSEVVTAFIPFMLALARVAALFLEIFLAISPLTNLLAKHGEFVSIAVEAYILYVLWGWRSIVMTRAAAAWTFILSIRTWSLAGAQTWLNSTMVPYLIILGALIFAHQTALEVWEALTIAIIYYALYQWYATAAANGWTLSVGAASIATGFWTVVTWAQNAALATMNVLLWPLWAIILAVAAAVLVVVAVFIYWEEIIGALAWAINGLLELLAKLANTLSLGLLDIGGSGLLWDDWGTVDVFHDGGMSHGGLAMLAAGETVKSAGAVSEEERQSYSGNGTGTVNNIQVSGVVDPNAAAGAVIRKLNRQGRLGFGSGTW